MNTQCNVDGEATLAPAGPYCWADGGGGNKRERVNSPNILKFYNLNSLTFFSVKCNKGLGE